MTQCLQPKISQADATSVERKDTRQKIVRIKFLTEAENARSVDVRTIQKIAGKRRKIRIRDPVGGDPRKK